MRRQPPIFTAAGVGSLALRKELWSTTVSTIVHLLYSSDPLSSYSKFIPPGNRVSRILVVLISWETWG